MKHANIAAKIKTSIVVSIFLLIFCGAVSAQERVSVVADIANMRSGPGTNNEILWQVEKYHPLIVIEKKGNWYRIRDFENDKAWLHKSLVGKIKSVITKKEKCNVREKPTTKSRIVFTTEKGVPFRVLSKKGNWIKIEHADGDVGWIHDSLIW